MLHLVAKASKKALLALADFRFSRAGLYCIEIDSGQEGFFAQLSGMMTLLRMCQRRGLKPYIVLSGRSYRDDGRGRNVLDYFFTPPRYTEQELALIRRGPVRRVTGCARIRGWTRDDYPALAESLDLFGAYYSLKSDLVAEVDAFARQHFAPGRTLGLHFRGTDKWSEASELEFESTVRFIHRCLRAYPLLDHLFVATDSQPYLDYIIPRLPSIRVSCHADGTRSTDSTGVHLSPGGDNFQKGRDALLNCLLLSRCDVLLKTMSNLSGWAKVFNPRLDVYLMNRPAKEGILWLGFPEREMVERGWFVESLGEGDQEP